MGLNFQLIKSLIDEGIFVEKSSARKLLEIGKLKNSLTNVQAEYLERHYGLPREVSKLSATQIYEYYGFTDVTTLDNSQFEGANLRHNLNLPPWNQLITLQDEFDLVIDGGTSEHIYSPITALTNYLFLTKKNGHLVQILPVNNFVDHGIYQFSPTFFYSIDLENLVLKVLTFFEHGTRHRIVRHWNGLSLTFKEHLHGTWDGSAMANLFRYSNKNIVAVAIWKKTESVDYETLMTNSQQEVYKEQWSNQQNLTAISLPKKYQFILRFIYQRSGSIIPMIMSRVILKKLSSK